MNNIPRETDLNDTNDLIHVNVKILKLLSKF